MSSSFLPTLMRGVTMNDIPSIRLILAQSFHDGMNPLMLAARDGNVAAVKNLVTYGCPLNAQDNRGYTALIYACRDGFFSIVQFLLAAGADASLSTKFGYSPLHAASINGYASIVSLLCEYVDPNTQDSEGFTPLICACMNNHADVVATLIQNGAQLSLADVSGRDAVVHAIDESSIQVIELLLRSHVHLLYKLPTFACSVLYIAAVRRQRAVVSLLVSNPLYLGEFIDDLIEKSSLVVEATVENALRLQSPYLSDNRRSLLADVVLSKARNCIKELLEVYMTTAQNTAHPLSGLVEASVWCNRAYKILISNAPAEELAFFWSFVEFLLALCSRDYKQRSTGCRCPTSCFGSLTLSVPNTPRQVKLLFSFIEIYCIGMSEVWNGGDHAHPDEVSYACSHRLYLLFQNNLPFIK